MIMWTEVIRSSESLRGWTDTGRSTAWRKSNIYRTTRRSQSTAHNVWLTVDLCAVKKCHNNQLRNNDGNTTSLKKWNTVCSHFLRCTGVWVARTPLGDALSAQSSPRVLRLSVHVTCKLWFVALFCTHDIYCIFIYPGRGIPPLWLPWGFFHHFLFFLPC